jgi:tRNA threonylcarbamoyladenosine biosynthesis protein TsaB
MTQPPMLLALDTATDTASVALFELGARQLLAELTWQPRRRQSRALLALAQTLLSQVDAQPGDISALAVTTGPGSFTGLRTAISAAKGIALGLPTAPRVVGVPTLCVTGAPWLPLACEITPPPFVCAYLRAGRGRYNWLFLHSENPLWRPIAADHAAGDVTEFARALAERSHPIWLVGELDEAIASVVAALHHIHVVDAVSGWRRAGHLAQVAARLLEANVEDNLRTLQPLYLRDP